MKNIFYYINWVCISFIELNIIKNIRNSLYKKIQNLPLSFLDKKRSGELLSITLNDVKQWMDKQTIAQLKPYKGFNSYVAHHPLQEIQIDIADFTRSGAFNKNYRYLFVAVDIFKSYLILS